MTAAAAPAAAPADGPADGPADPAAGPAAADQPDRFAADLVRGSLDLMALGVLAGAPPGGLYGLAVQQELRAASGGRVAANPGTLYPLLHRLEQDGLVAATWRAADGRRRKWYALTDAGRAKLADRAAQWFAHADLVRRLLEPALNPAPTPPRPALAPI